MSLEKTGERLIVEGYQSSPEDYVIYLMHVAAYRFAEPLTAGGRVLDYGCGTGYGAARIARVARRVDAVDVDEDAIAHARERHRRGNLEFVRVGPSDPLPFGDRVFDAVLSFQVLEHVGDTARYLSEARRVLAPGGTLVLVTPDRNARLLPLQRPWNRWHREEFSARTLQALLARFFQSVELHQMSGRPEVVAIELRRYRRLKWLTLPATLPVIPDALRVRLLGLAHSLRRAGSSPPSPRPFGFDESALVIGPGLRPSLNLVAIARG
jgi:SAM-dependent methyltransferase